MKPTLWFLVACLCFLPAYSQLPDFYQTVDRLIWVVEDMDQTLAELQKLGFTNLRDFGFVQLTGAQYRGAPTDGEARVVFGRFGNVRVQWVEPRGGHNAFQDFRHRHGSGVFSLMHRTPSAEAFQAEVDRLSGLGVNVLQAGEVPFDAGTIRYTFFDTAPEGKYTLGLLHFPNDNEGPFLIPPDNPSGRTVSQFAFVVKALEPVSAYWARLGWPAMQITHGPLTDKKFRGRPADFDMKLGWQRHGQVVYEWILSTRGPDIYGEHLEEHGEGFHHLAFQVEDMDADLAWWAERGYPETMSGGWGEKGKPGSGRFAYVDARRLGGIALELLWNFRASR
ncbi:MAG: hypothetical protein Kow001_25380 [Acidobacteriota bacterium]